MKLNILANKPHYIEAAKRYRRMFGYPKGRMQLDWQSFANRDKKRKLKAL